MMKIAEIRELTNEQIQDKVYELKQELLSLRFAKATGQLDNGKKVTEVRKTIARCYTVLTEREGLN